MHDVKLCGEMEVRLHSFLPGRFVGGEWSASRPSCFVPRIGALLAVVLEVVWAPDPVGNFIEKKNTLPVPGIES